MSKTAIRKEILSQRINFLGLPEFKTSCAAISENIFQFLTKKAEAEPLLIGGYSSIKGEVDLTNLYNEITNLAFPRIVLIKNHSEIEYAKISSLSELSKSRLSFMEPPNTGQICYPDIILVPGISFDKNKRRIGYGMGHFDKFFMHGKKSDYNPIKIGICFNFQLQNSLPHEIHDQNMDYIITESTII